MKYEYRSVTGKYNIEVDERFNEIMMAMDTEEEISQSKYERPRHDRPRNISLDSVDYEGKWFDDGTDVFFVKWKYSKYKDKSAVPEKKRKAC